MNTTIQFQQAIVIVLNDNLSELAELCFTFQQTNITTIEAVQFAKAKINQLGVQAQ